jgi:ectoine hydroxylase-related dioxygenase (phytanoyl-CoA dioxygenase family)
MWTALDPATIANGCVQIIPGSHRLGLLSERGHTISAEHEEEHCDPAKVVHLELEPGETVLLHNWTLHRSDINRTPFPRRAFSVCYMDARTTKRGTGRTFPVVFGKGALQPLGAP